MGTDRQDDYVRALAFGLLDESERGAAAGRLVELIRGAGGHLGTGFLSTPLLLDALVANGHAETAWDLLTSTSNPCWLHQVALGATTVWETWEGYKKSGKAKMSHNHYALGSVARLLTERVAGITPDEPGYRLIGTRPLTGGGLTWARASVGTPYGLVESNWSIDGDEVHYRISVPPGARARFEARADAASIDLGPGAHVITRSRSNGADAAPVGSNRLPNLSSFDWIAVRSSRPIPHPSEAHRCRRRPFSRGSTPTLRSAA